MAAVARRRSPAQDRELPEGSTSRRSIRAAMWRGLRLGTSLVDGRSVLVRYQRNNTERSEGPECTVAPSITTTQIAPGFLPSGVSGTDVSELSPVVGRGAFWMSPLAGAVDCVSSPVSASERAATCSIPELGDGATDSCMSGPGSGETARASTSVEAGGL